MKKSFLAAAMAALLLGGTPAFAAGENLESGGGITAADVGEALALYIPNRLLDALDMFTVNLGVGPVLQARLMGTRLADVGAGIGRSYKIYKTHNRQYGLGIEEGYYWSFIFVGEEDYHMIDCTSLIKNYSETRAGVPDPTTRTYDFFTGPRDYWAIGGSLGGLVDGDLYIHPLEWLDFALGFFFIDFRNDDLTFRDFQ